MGTKDCNGVCSVVCLLVVLGIIAGGIYYDLSHPLPLINSSALNNSNSISTQPSIYQLEINGNLIINNTTYTTLDPIVNLSFSTTGKNMDIHIKSQSDSIPKIPPIPANDCGGNGFCRYNYFNTTTSLYNTSINFKAGESYLIIINNSYVVRLEIPIKVATLYLNPSLFPHFFNYTQICTNQNWCTYIINRTDYYEAFAKNTSKGACISSLAQQMTTQDYYNQTNKTSYVSLNENQTISVIRNIEQNEGINNPQAWKTSKPFELPDYNQYTLLCPSFNITSIPNN